MEYWTEDKNINVCFNPCFNGRCKRTIYTEKLFLQVLYVSILVLMEDVKELKPCSRFDFNIPVSILVLMEDVKEQR